MNYELITVHHTSCVRDHCLLFLMAKIGNG